MPDVQTKQQAHRKKEKRGNIADTPDLSHLNASPLKIILPEHHHTLKFYLVGCGGTGSWLAPHLVRLARFLRETRQMKVHVTFIDPDVIETKNVFRQSFGEAEVGGHKAELLALRYAATWGQGMEVHTSKFAKEMVQLEYRDLGVIVGCVDNAAARRTIADPKGLTTLATYCNLSVLSTRSRFITPETVAHAIDKQTNRVFKSRVADK